MCIHRYKKERLWLWRDKPAQAVKKRQTASYIGFNERGVRLFVLSDSQSGCLHMRKLVDVGYILYETSPIFVI